MRATGSQLQTRKLLPSNSRIDSHTLVHAHPIVLEISFPSAIEGLKNGMTLSASRDFDDS